MGDDDKFDINLDNITENSDGTFTITLNPTHDGSIDDYTYTSSTIDTISTDFGNWSFGNYKQIDLDILEKYPTAKTLYNEFISVYNMCEAEEKLNGEGDEYPF